MFSSVHWTALFQRLVAKIVKTVDISYGGENGLNQAIELSADCLASVKFVQEKKLIGEFPAVEILEMEGL